MRTNIAIAAAVAAALATATAGCSDITDDPQVDQGVAHDGFVDVAKHLAQKQFFEYRVQDTSCALDHGKLYRCTATVMTPDGPLSVAGSVNLDTNMERAHWSD